MLSDGSQRPPRGLVRFAAPRSGRYPAAILIATLRGTDYMNFDMGKIYMMITVAIVPIIIVYLLLSKYIIAGITLGGVKE